MNEALTIATGQARRDGRIRELVLARRELDREIEALAGDLSDTGDGPGLEAIGSSAGFGTAADFDRLSDGEARAGAAVPDSQSYIAAAQAYAQTLIETSPMAIVTYRASGQGVSANLASVRLLGGSDVSAVTSLNFRQLPLWKSSGLVALADEALASGSGRELDVRGIDSLGKAIALHCRLIPFTYAGGAYLLAFLEDVSERQAAAATLERGQALLRMASRMGRLGAWTLTLPSLELSWSEEVRAIHELPPEFVPTVDSAVAFYAPEFREGIRESVRLCLSEGVPFDMELQIVSAQGRRVWVRSIGEGVRDLDGQIVRVQGAFQDITESKQAAAVLREVQQRYEIAVRGSEAGLWDWDIATDVAYFAPRFREMLGFTEEEFPNVLASFQDALHPDDRAATFAAIEQHLQHRVPFNVEYRLRTARGEYRWFHATGRAVWDVHGSPSRMAGSTLDITDRRLAAEQLRLSDERFHLLSRATNDAIWDWNLANDALWWNEGLETLFGFNPDAIEPTVHSWYNRLHPLEKDAVIASVHHAIGTGAASWSAEYRFLRRDGGYADVLDRGHIIRDEAGTAVRMIGGMTDWTERKRSASALAQSNRALKLHGCCNEALIRSATEEDLLAAVCRIAVESGGYSLAWVGYAPKDGARTVSVQAHAGVHDGYLSELAVNWSADAGDGRGPAGRAIESGEAVVVADTETDTRFRAWGVRARGHGFRGVVCLPLADQARTFGVLVLHVPDARTSLVEDVDLLRELGADLAFGIVNLRAHADRRRTQDAVLAMARGVSAATGSEFFKTLTFSMVEALDAPGGLIARLNADGTVGGTLCMFLDRQCVEGFEYAPQGSRWDNAGRRELWMVGADPPGGYPLAPSLAGMGFQACLARTLVDAAGQPIGLLLVLFRQPPAQVEFISSTLKIFATRAAGELERQNADVQLRDQASLLDKARDAIIVRDLEHRILYWNRSAERLYGWSASEAVGRSVRDLLYRDPQPFLEATAVTVRDGEWVGEIEQMTRDGQVRTVEGHWTLVRDETGAPKSLLSINTDITERKRMEQQAFRAQRLESLGTLAGGIAHDLNNVLAPILLAVGLLQIEEADPERREVLNTIEASATRGAAMVRQVLSFARGVEGRRAVVDPSTVIGDVVRIMRDTFPKAIHVESRPGPVLWPLRADATQLHQVLLNLCVNARDAMADGGRIAITAENVQIDAQYAALHLGARVGPHVAIEVSDTGPGIPAAIIDKIFDPFFTTKEIGKGTGLGLATSLTIMKGHGGFIRVHSDPGAGTRFRLFLPAEPGTEEQRLEAPAPLLSRGNGQIVLLVDDEASIRQINKQTLEAYGYRVLLAEDGAAAIAIYGEHCRDVAVVITDMMMPLMGGLTLSGILQGMNPRVRIIGASGLAEAATVAAAAAAGVGQFLAKPYTAEALLTAVSAALAEPS